MTGNSPGSKVRPNYRWGRRLEIFQVREIFVLVLVDLAGREELRIIVLAGESKMESIVLLNDTRVVVIINFGSLRGSRRAIIVCGDRQRPTAERQIV